MKLENLPRAFADRVAGQLDGDIEAFLFALQQEPPVSIRLHPDKGQCSFACDDKVKWCDLGCYLNARPRFAMDPHWHAGAYYVQEASSMILDEVVRQIKSNAASQVWIDLCAAPGGKTGILHRHLNDSSVLLANEVDARRRSILKENLIKGGYRRTFLSGLKASAFPDQLADLILVDAPCAGEGMMRKEEEAIRQWSPGLVTSCALRQKDIIAQAIRILKPGGLLLYSTCSYSDEENIVHMDRCLSHGGLENIPLSFQEEWNIKKVSCGKATGHQLWPHLVKGEGLFVAALQKSDEETTSKRGKLHNQLRFASPSGYLAEYMSNPHAFFSCESADGDVIVEKETLPLTTFLTQEIRGIEPLAIGGQQKGKDFIPSHFLAMSNLLRDDHPFLNLSEEESLDYLERQLPSVSPSTPGWYLARFNGSNLGWLKSTPQGWKNHYPLAWRLRNRTWAV